MRVGCDGDGEAGRGRSSVDRAVRLTRRDGSARRDDWVRAGSWRWDSRAVGFFCSGDGVDPADLTDAFPLGGLPILLVSFARSPPASPEGTRGSGGAGNMSGAFGRNGGAALTGALRRVRSSNPRCSRRVTVPDKTTTSRDRRWEVEGDRGRDGGARERVASEGWFSSPSRSERLC